MTSEDADGAEKIAEGQMKSFDHPFPAFMPSCGRAHVEDYQSSSQDYSDLQA